MAVVFKEPAAQEHELFVVGMGEIVVTASPDAVLSCIGLGSCVAVCAYDSMEKIGGMVHVVLPNHNGSPGANHAKFADTAVPLLINEMIKKGGVRRRMVVKIAGGARMSLAPWLRDTFTGGTIGRTVKFYIDTGRVTVKTASGTAQELK